MMVLETDASTGILLDPREHRPRSTAPAVWALAGAAGALAVAGLLMVFVTAGNRRRNRPAPRPGRTTEPGRASANQS